MTTQLVSALFFAPGLDRDLAQQRYKGLARVLHPDVPTGDTRLMQTLNNEYDAYKAGRLSTASVAPPPPPPPQNTYAGQRVTQIAQAGTRLINGLPFVLRNAAIEFNVDLRESRVTARGTDCYELREMLKLYYFKWNPTDKCWWTEVRV